MILSGWGVDWRVEPREIVVIQEAIRREASVAMVELVAFRLNPRAVVVMGRLERLVDFDPNTGLLICEVNLFRRLHLFLLNAMQS